MSRTPWRRRGPVVRQLSTTDCGAACLAMVLAHHGRDVPLHHVQTTLETGRDGADAAAIVRAAETFGLRGHFSASNLDVHLRSVHDVLKPVRLLAEAGYRVKGIIF